MAKTSRIPKFGLAIDWETTGYSTPNYAESHQGISFGAIIYDVKTFEAVDSIYREIKFDPKYTWSDGAERIHGISREYLEANGVSQEVAAVDLANLVIKYIGTEDILLLGHRVLFDKAFTQQLMSSAGLEFSYNPIVIDTCALSTVLLEVSYSDELFELFGFQARGKHNALEDITMTLESVKRIKTYFTSGLLQTLTD